MREDILRRLGSRYIPIAPKRLATSQYSGEWSSPYKGKGLEFASHRPYQLGDDFRTIHMATSIRTGSKMVVERIVKRDISLLIVLDCSPSMSVRFKTDMLLATSLMLLYSAVNMELRTGAAFAGTGGYYHLGMGMGQKHALRLSNIIEKSCKSLKEGRPVATDYPMVDIHRILPVGGILIYISDFLDKRGFGESYDSFAIAAKRYDFIPIVIQDELEYSFPQMIKKTMMVFTNPESGATYPVWMGSAEKKLIKSLHEKRFSNLREEFSRNGIGFAHVASPVIDQIHKILTQFFVSRS